VAASGAAAQATWRTEDWVATILGFVVIAFVLAAFTYKTVDLRNLVSSFRWTTDAQIASSTPAWNSALDSIIADANAKKQQNVVTLGTNLKTALAGKDRKAIETEAGKLAALGSRSLAGALGGEIRGHASAQPESKIFNAENLTKVLYIGIGFLIVAAAASRCSGGKCCLSSSAFRLCSQLAWIARLLAGNGLFVDWGIEYVIFALLLGLLISNTIGTPEWLMPAVQTEFSSRSVS
jgi:hypothetical protein